MNKEELTKAFENKAENTVPVAFWHHFATNEFISAGEHPEVNKININGHRQYVSEAQPDFMKLMTDGYFLYPFENVENAQDLASLSRLTNIKDDNQWLLGQQQLVRAQKEAVNDRFTFYNVFSPLTILKWSLIDHESESLEVADKKFADLYTQDPKLVTEILKRIGEDVKKQIDVVTDAGADGVYYSTQSIQDERVYNKDFFDDVQEPVDLAVIDEINHKSSVNILHVCGFDGAENHLDWYTNYPLQIINWSTHTDGYTLGEGKKLFKDKVVLGGFGINKDDVLYNGTKDEIEAEVNELLSEAGTTGVIIGADCTIQRDTPLEHIKWAEAAVHSFTQTR